MKWIAVIAAFVVLGAIPLSGLINGEGESTSTEKTKEAESTNQDEDQNVTPPGVPVEMTFCGENVPLDKYHVYEALDREIIVNTYFHSSTIRMLKLANRFFPTIEKVLAEEGLPDDLKYIAMAESGLQQEAVSPAGARGIWQIMKATGKEYGLECAIEIDERYHLEKATKVATTYLKKAHAKFGNWASASASYNCGMRALQRQIDNQKQSNYFDLYLNSETGRYVYRILALKLLYNNPQLYGFQIPSDQLYQTISYRTVEVKKIDNMADFAAKNGVTYKDLKLLNPWLRSTAVEPRKSGKIYQIKVPQN